MPHENLIFSSRVPFLYPHMYLSPDETDERTDDSHEG